MTSGCVESFAALLPVGIRRTRNAPDSTDPYEAACGFWLLWLRRSRQVGRCVAEIVDQRIHTCRVGILAYIFIGAEQRIRIAPLLSANAQVMQQGIDARSRHIRILLQVKGAVEDRVRGASFPGPGIQKMEERIHTGFAHVFVLG